MSDKQPNNLEKPMSYERPNERPNKKPSQKIVAHFDIPFFHCLDSLGEAQTSLPESAKNFKRLKELYRMMVQVRAFDQRAIALQRTGQLGTYASCLGQEAIGTAIGDVMQADDVLLPSYRETPAMLMRGVSMYELLLYWGGDERGMAYDNNQHDFPVSVPIASQAPHAVGVASAFKLRRQPRVAVCVLGDGGSSKGDFYEALNLAGAWKLPVVFVVVNNQWAISVRRETQSGAQTLAQKAIAAGIACEQVDGNDLIILRERFARAMDQARNGEPCLIEALSYRLGDHTTADDASRYRDQQELDKHWQLEPLVRIKRYLENAGEWNDSQESDCAKRCEAELSTAVDTYLAAPAPAPESMFDCLYETLPTALEWQLQQARDKGQGCG